MNLDKEMERHVKVLEDIKNAKSKASLPKVTQSNLYRYFCDNAYFDRKLEPSKFEPILKLINNNGTFASFDVRNAFMQILRENYPGHDESDYEEKYNNISSIKVDHLIDEIHRREDRIIDFERVEDLDKHNEIMRKINNAYEMDDLPKVTKATLNSFICHSSRCLPTPFKVSDISDICDRLINGEDIKSSRIKEELLKVFEDTGYINDEMFSQFYSRVADNDKIKYIVEEINARNKREDFIYKTDYEDIMERICDARRISELPNNLTFSILAGYLSSNTTIYTKAKKISSTKFANLTNLLLDGKKMDDDEVKYEIKSIASEAYPDKADEAYHLLYDKLSKLPKTYYLVNEINESNKRQEEFIGRGASNVNVYFIPNPKSPADGGLFYTCYINRVGNLDLQDIVPSPLDLDKLVPKDLDQDAIEWYVREHYDDTFKTAGGIILNRDESIGNVSVFKPYEGGVEISYEEHSKYQELEEISKQIKSIIAMKRKDTESFNKYQEEFLKRQAETDMQLAELEAKINKLTDINEEGKGAR